MSALAWAVAACGDASAVKFDEGFDEGESKAEATELSFAAAVALAEAVEDVGEEVGGDALPVIANLDACGGAIARETNRDGSALLGEFDGVGEEVPDDLANAVGIAGDVAGDGVEVDLEADIFGVGGRADDVDGFVDEDGKLGGRDFQLKLAGDNT